MNDDIAYKYDEKKNPAGTWVDGVPLDDLTVARFKRLPKHLQAAVKAQPYYVAVEKETKAAPKKPAAKKETPEREVPTNDEEVKADG